MTLPRLPVHFSDVDMTPKFNPTSPQEWLCVALRTGSVSALRVSQSFKKLDGISGFGSGNFGGWIPLLQADSPESTPPPCGSDDGGKQEKPPHRGGFWHRSALGKKERPH